MAYIDQKEKKLLAPKIKAVLKKYGMKGSISILHHSKLVVTVKTGKLDVFANYIKVSAPERDVTNCLDVNPYYIKESFDGKVRNFLLELHDAMNCCDEIANHDNSDIMTDYFDVGWYTSINIGQWDKPYKLAA